MGVTKYRVEHVSRVGEATGLVSTLLLRLYLKEVTGLGLGPHRRGGAVMTLGAEPPMQGAVTRIRLKPANTR
jgi:hypothetical protein